MFTRMLGASTRQCIFESLWLLSLSYPTKPTTMSWYHNRLFTSACVKFASCVYVGLRVEIRLRIVPIWPILHCPVSQIQRSQSGRITNETWLCCSEWDHTASEHRGTQDQLAAYCRHDSPGKGCRQRRRTSGRLPGEHWRPRRALERAWVLHQSEERSTETSSWENCQGNRNYMLCLKTGSHMWYFHISPTINICVFFHLVKF